VPGLEQFQVVTGVDTSVLSLNNITIEIGYIGAMTREEAELQLQKKSELIHGLYTNMPNPYPGLISDEIVCGEEFKPELVLNGTELYIEGYVTPRRTFGACSFDLIAYRAFVRYLYCNGNLVYIKGFVPLNDTHSSEIAKQIVGATSCP